MYGNANNDDYYNDDDLKFIEDIVNGYVTWDSDEYPYADANYDGVVDSEDIDYLQNFLDGGDGKMYYYDMYGNVSYFNYPLGDRKIATMGGQNTYGLDTAELFDIYDQVIAADNDAITYLSENRYPGVSSLINLGTYKNSDYTDYLENVLASDATVILCAMSASEPSIYYDLVEADLDTPVDYIMLSCDCRLRGGADVVSKIMTMGVLFDKTDIALLYQEMYEDMVDYISEATADVDPYSLVVPYYANNDTGVTDNATTTYLHTLGSSSDVMFGDLWTLYHLPVEDIAEHTGNGYYEVEIEQILAWDPDILIISTWGEMDIDTSAEEAQEFFDTAASYFSETTAYKNGMVFGICFETVGTYLGMGILPLLCSYIWPDLFDEDEGWEILQEWYATFTCLDESVDLTDAGGLLVYKINCS